MFEKINIKGESRSAYSVAFMTLGCKVNQYETETMEGLFVSGGHRVVPFEEKADVYIINTCSVTVLGEKKSRQIIRRASRENPDALICATGCYAQLSPDSVASIEGVGLIVGTQDRGRIVELVDEALRNKLAGGEAINDVGDIMRAEEFEDIPLSRMPSRTRAFLKIQEGCENFCSYCIIPYTRGPLRSRSLESVRGEARKLIEAGFAEIVLTGIHLGAYGRDIAREGGNRVTLADAAREILAAGCGEHRLRRLRLGSLESIELSPELITLIREDARLARHLHLPIQSGSDAVLHAMNRHYDKATFARLVENVRREVPGIAISTDIIVGFPGETDEMFEESLAFAREMSFSRMHVFPFSARPGTPAARMNNQIPSTVKKERVHMMERAAHEMAEKFHAAHIGETAGVLFESDSGGIKDGLTGTYVRVYTEDDVRLGEITEMRLVRLHKDGVWAEKNDEKIPWQGHDLT